MLPETLDDGELPVLSGAEVTEVRPPETEVPGLVGPAVAVLLEIGYGAVFEFDELTPPDTLEVMPPETDVPGFVGPAVVVAL